MGRQDNFFMDEVSVFRNPANISFYPNMVYGSYGVYRETPAEDTTMYAALSRKNRDPENPFFGALVSYSLKKNTEKKGSERIIQYPMISFGAVVNRRDELLDYITPGNSRFVGPSSAVIRPPTGKLDLLAGYVLENGAMIGVGTYLAFQSFTENGMVQSETSVYKGTAGINWPVAQTTNLEVSGAAGIMRSMGDSSRFLNSPKTVVADNDFFVKGDARLFSGLSLLKGDLVPHVGGLLINLKDDLHQDIQISEINAGVGVNVNIDKGLFWTGVEGIYRRLSGADSTRTGIGGRLSFGIERSIWREWFIIRVGGQKTLLYNSVQLPTGDRSYWEENDPSDGSDNDLVSLGFGLNVENRLRLDFVAAEDVAYTFANIVSGPQHHLFTRVSATYRF
jgi:hypothetical protein